MIASRKSWKKERHPIFRYGLAVLVVVVAIGLLRIPEFGSRLGGLFFFAVLISAWYGGLWPGMVTTGLTLAIFVVGSTVQIRNGSVALIPAIARVGLFTACGVITTLLVEGLHRARRRAEVSAGEAERHQATVRQSEARLEAILEHSPAVVYMKDLDGRYLMINRRFATLFHVTASGVAGKTDLELFPEATAEQFRANDRRVIETGRAIEFEETVQQDDGEHVYLSVKFPLYESDGTIAAICGKSTDITDRKRNDEHRARLGRHSALRADVGTALARAEPALGSILQECAGAVVRHLDVLLARLWTVDAPGEALILEASAGSGPRDDDQECAVRFDTTLIDQIVRERQPCGIDDLRAADEAAVPASLGWGRLIAFAGYPLIVEDRLLGVMAVFAPRPFDDDTREALAALADVIAQGIERIRLEQERIELLARERRARGEAESANRAKDQFLAVLSHELRTPLTPILASVSALLDDPSLPAETRSVLELTQSGIELESRLIRDLLEMTRILKGRLRLYRERVDVHTLILRAVKTCRGQLEAGRVELVLDLAAAVSQVLADPSRLEHVIWSLTQNALKFSPQGGTLTIRTRNEDRPPAPSDSSIAPPPDLVIAITDTGIGIEPEVLPSIFDAFTQGEAGWIRRFGGLGVGLAISRSVIEAHGGAIGAESGGKDQGATFTITLATVGELAAAAATMQPPDAGELASTHVSATAGVERSTRNFKLLLVEDDGPTLKVMTRLLARMPYLVKTANTFAAAMEIATTESFDLIISDIGLPDGSGLDLMRTVRGRYTARGIALSGFGMDEDIRRSHEAGFLVHLTKPVDFQKLQVTIEQVTATLV